MTPGLRQDMEVRGGSGALYTPLLGVQRRIHMRALGRIRCSRSTIALVSLLGGCASTPPQSGSGRMPGQD